MDQFVSKYPPRDPAKVRETCPRATPSTALEPAIAATCWPQTTVENYCYPRLGSRPVSRGRERGG